MGKEENLQGCKVCFQSTVSSSRAATWCVLLGWGCGGLKICVSNCVSVLQEAENKSSCSVVFCFIAVSSNTVTWDSYRSTTCPDVIYRKAADLLKMWYMKVTGWRKATVTLQKILSNKKKNASQIAPDFYLFLIELYSQPDYCVPGIFVYRWVIFVLPLPSAPSLSVCGISFILTSICCQAWPVPATDQITNIICEK